MFNSAYSLWAANDKSELFDKLNDASQQGIDTYRMMGPRSNSSDRFIFDMWVNFVERILREIDSKYGTSYLWKFNFAKYLSRGDLKDNFLDALKALTEIMRDFSKV